MAKEAAGLGLPALRLKSSLIFTDGSASSTDWKTRGTVVSKMSLEPSHSHLMSTNFGLARGTSRSYFSVEADGPALSYPVSMG